MGYPKESFHPMPPFTTFPMFQLPIYSRMRRKYLPPIVTFKQSTSTPWFFSSSVMASQEAPFLPQAILDDLLAPIFSPMPPRKPRSRNTLLFFIKTLLDGGDHSDVIVWTEELTFQIRNQKKFTKMYGEHTGNTGINFELIMRIFRSYGSKGLIRKIAGFQNCWRIVDKSIFSPPKKEDPVAQMVRMLSQPKVQTQISDAVKEFDRYLEMFPFVTNLNLTIEEKISFFNSTKDINPDFFKN
uniref:ETS domain-containing protein n=1 Tax=Caenorhabditis tropicalis TaxID=1561998 RepID=A0A1I7UIP1_9PELO